MAVQARKEGETQHRIAILLSAGVDDYYDDRRIIQSITEWTEVDTGTLEKLRAAQHMYGYTVLVRPVNEQDFIVRTVQQWSDFLDQQAKREAEELEARQRKLEQNRLNKLAKNRDDKLRLLNKLKAELGEV